MAIANITRLTRLIVRVRTSIYFGSTDIGDADDVAHAARCFVRIRGGTHRTIGDTNSLFPHSDTARSVSSSAALFHQAIGQGAKAIRNRMIGKAQRENT